MAAKADGAFATDSAVKKSADFVCVKGTQKQANQYHVKGAPMVLITDPDGDELCRATFTDERVLTAAMDAALKKYQNAPVSWGSEIRSGSGSKKLLVVGFDDEKGEGLKVLEDRSLVKYHEKCEFVKLPYEKEGELAKKWGVSQVPAIFLCDPAKENPERAPLEKLFGKKTTAAVKVAIQKALAKEEKR